MTKTAKITECKFDKPWSPPTGGTLYPHDLTLDNGDKGKIYYKSQTPDELAPGATITYELNDKGKITLITKNEKDKMFQKSSNSKQFDPIGLAFSYAKDLIVAQLNNKVTFKDVALSDEIIKIAEPIAIKMNELNKQFKSQE